MKPTSSSYASSCPRSRMGGRRDTRRSTQQSALSGQSKQNQGQRERSKRSQESEDKKLKAKTTTAEGGPRRAGIFDCANTSNADTRSNDESSFPSAAADWELQLNPPQRISPGDSDAARTAQQAGTRRCANTDMGPNHTSPYPKEATHGC